MSAHSVQSARSSRLDLHLAFGWWWADPVAALAMLPVIVWQGWETLEEARDEQAEDE